MYERERKASENPARTSRITGQNMVILISLMLVWCFLYAHYEWDVWFFIAGMLVICFIAWRLDRRLW